MCSYDLFKLLYDLCTVLVWFVFVGFWMICDCVCMIGVLFCICCIFVHMCSYDLCKLMYDL